MKIQINVPLAECGTFRMGGRAKEVIQASSPEEIMEAVREVSLRQAQEIITGFCVFAGGSNIVFPDEGIQDTLIRVLGGEIKVESCKLIVDSGVLLGDVIKKAISLGLQGLETLSGIPGTIGGAVYGNAGAYGASISNSVQKVEVLISKSRKSQITIRQLADKSQTFVRKWVSREQCKFGYRESIFKELSGSPSINSGNSMSGIIILRVVLRLQKGDRKALEAKSREIIALREKKYKPGIRCPGSFFKNVLVKDVSKKSLSLVDSSKIIDGKIPAGWLLEQVGAKGMREGGVYIADFHGNLFVNEGTGMARDVRALARILKKKVFDRFGIELEEEVRYF